MLKKEEKYLDTKEDFEKFYELYFDRAFRVAKGILKNENSAADAVQETFIRVYKYRDTYDHKSSFNAWFSTILLNECRRQMEKNKYVTYIADYEEVKMPSSNWTKEWETKSMVLSMLNELEEKIKLPIILKYIQGLKINEIAKILELNPNTVKSRLAFGKAKMKQSYEEVQKEARL